MTRQEMLLIILMEECDETSQRASKAIRFGLDEVQEGQTLTNAERLVYEFNDILAVMEILSGEGIIPYHIDAVAAGLKKVKIEKWLQYSLQMGTLSKEVVNPEKSYLSPRISTSEYQQLPEGRKRLYTRFCGDNEVYYELNLGLLS